MSRILSGIKPTGNLTLGNYIGSLKNFPAYQNENETYIFIADIHALTMPIDPSFLFQNCKEILAFYLASGLDPQKTVLFRQSDIPEVSELNSILINFINMGELSRMTQYKEKSASLDGKEIGAGLFTYPVLMAADIFLYGADLVPVGEDQRQHVELAHDIAKRFNHRYSDILKMPKAVNPKVGKRIMSLSDPTKKMSKSDPKGDIFLKDDLKTMRKKIMSAVTDIGCEVKYDPINKPGISNLLQIYSALKEKSLEEAEEDFVGANYGTFKKGVADALEEVMAPFQERFYKYLSDEEYMREVLKAGALKARQAAQVTLKAVKDAVGFLAF